jgi:ribosomal protein S18 acetylase RimI-like enzyme
VTLDLDVHQSQINFNRVRLPRRVFVPYPNNKNAIFKDIDEAQAFLIAEVSKNPVGYIKVVSEKDPHTAKITDLVISANNRRQGIGSGLLVAVMDLLAHRDVNMMIIELQSKNDPAIKMVKKMGFKFCGFRDYYFSNQELALFYSRFIG